MKLTKALGLAAAFTAVAIGIAGCGEPTGYQPTQVSSNEKPIPSAFKIEQIKAGNFLDRLGDGAYKLTIDHKTAGTKNDLNCIMIKDRDGLLELGYSGLSCDYVSANASIARGP